MDKIGICACYNTLNYGSMLQAFATQKVIEELGYESEYIRYKKKKTISFIIKQIPRFFNGNLMFDKMLEVEKKIALLYHPDIKRKNNIRKAAFERFKDKYYGDFSPVYYGYDELKKGAANYNSVIVGSDQLWTPGGLATNFYNLMFVPDEINKISYATSFGVSKIPFYQRRRTKAYLTRINYLSVRETKGAQIVERISGRTAKVVVDPTLLFSREKWLKEIPERRLIKEKYIFCYFLGKNEEHRKIAEELRNKTGLKIVCTPFLDSFVKRDVTFGDSQLFDVGPDDFINLIRGAEYILTDSFHGSVFSIIHHKQFVTLNRFTDGGQSRNSRIDSLCGMLGLEERRYRGDICNQIQQFIDYKSVDKKLLSVRRESLDFLKDALTGNQCI